MFTREATKLLFSTLFLYISPFIRCATNAPASGGQAPNLDDPKEILYKALSEDAYFNLPCHSNETTVKPYRRLGSDTHAVYKHMNLSVLNFEQVNAQPALQPPAEVVDTDRYNRDQASKTLGTLNPDAFTIFHLCYAVSYIYRRGYGEQWIPEGRKGIHRYYHLRETYTDHLPFEIGYMTQAIMAKYQNVLELYEYSTTLEGPENKIGRPHLFFFYKNILEDCKLIIHLCNMMHEVTRKYRLLQYSAVGKPWIFVTYDPTKKFQEKSGNFYVSKFGMDELDYHYRDYERGIEGFEHEKYLHESPEIYKKIKHEGMVDGIEKKREYKMQKPKRLEFQNFGTFTKIPSLTSMQTRKTRTWNPNSDGPIDYGWSPEDSD